MKLNRFHTTALCSPTRQALLTGRNHDSVNMGGIWPQSAIWLYPQPTGRVTERPGEITVGIAAHFIAEVLTS